jgi:hypothetical protein
MDVIKILVHLKAQCEHLEEAILALERFAAGSGKRRGRPPAWMTAARKTDPSEAPTGHRKKRTLSPEARAKMAAAQKRRWAAARRSSAQTAA